VLSLLWVCTSIFVRLVCFNKMFDGCTGNWREISTLFETFFLYFGSPGIYVTKTVKKCLQFVYIFADLLPVKCQTKFLILAVKCLTNCLLLQSIFFFKLSAQCLYKNKPFLPNNYLTIIKTFYRLIEAYCLYNRMEEYTFLQLIYFQNFQHKTVRLF
jgi:hypothetical protein